MAQNIPTEEELARAERWVAVQRAQIELAEAQAQADMAEAERISAASFCRMSPADVYFAHKAVGLPRGLNQAQTLQNVHVMRGGKLSEHAAQQWGDVERSGLLEDVQVIERSARAVVLDVKRRGRSPQRISWTMEDAQRAGLARSQTWQQYPARMLEARAKTEAATLIFADVVTGQGSSGANTYSTEEAAFFSGRPEDEAALSAVVGDAPSTAPPERSTTEELIEPASQQSKVGAHLLERLKQMMDKQQIPHEVGLTYLKDRGIAPPSSYQELTRLFDEHFNLDGPFYLRHPTLLPLEDEKPT
tara:strand:+ start:1203 stop:2111 length:909 start_codon:yes stop_codon:yes gene_type:complete